MQYERWEFTRSRAEQFTRRTIGYENIRNQDFEIKRREFKERKPFSNIGKNPTTRGFFDFTVNITNVNVVREN